LTRFLTVDPVAGALRERRHERRRYRQSGEERRARTALGGSVANLHALIASPRDGWMNRERFEKAAE
jgi:hypothetical protein